MSISRAYNKRQKIEAFFKEDKNSLKVIKTKERLKIEFICFDKAQEIFLKQHFGKFY